MIRGMAREGQMEGMTMTTETFKAKRWEAGSYEYRNHQIREYKATPRGTVGRWRIHSLCFTTLREAKEYIDRKYSSVT